MRSHVYGTLVLSADSKAPAHDARLLRLQGRLVFAEHGRGRRSCGLHRLTPPLPAALEQTAKVTAAYIGQFTIVAVFHW